MKEAALSLTIMKEVTLSLKIMSLTFTFNDNYVGGCTFINKYQAAALSLKKGGCTFTAWTEVGFQGEKLLLVAGEAERWLALLSL